MKSLFVLLAFVVVIYAGDDNECFQKMIKSLLTQDESNQSPESKLKQRISNDFSVLIAYRYGSELSMKSLLFSRHRLNAKIFEEQFVEHHHIYDKAVALWEKYTDSGRKQPEKGLEVSVEEEEFVETLLKSRSMSNILSFLNKNCLIDRNVESEKDILMRIWFTRTTMGDNSIPANAFERIFILKPAFIHSRDLTSNKMEYLRTDTHGLEELLHKLDFTAGQAISNDASIVSIRNKQPQIVNKDELRMFLGLSLPLEMGIYTGCFFIRPNEKCEIQIKGSRIYNVITETTSLDGHKIITFGHPI